MKWYNPIANFSIGETKYFKGVLVRELPNTMRNFFQEVDDEKRTVDVSSEEVETASKKPRSEKRRRIKHG